MIKVDTYLLNTLMVENVCQLCGFRVEALARPIGVCRVQDTAVLATYSY